MNVTHTRLGRALATTALACTVGALLAPTAGAHARHHHRSGDGHRSQPSVLYVAPTGAPFVRSSRAARRMVMARALAANWQPRRITSEASARDRLRRPICPMDTGRIGDGHGWFRTTDLSRVKRALSH